MFKIMTKAAFNRLTLRANRLPCTKLIIVGSSMQAHRLVKLGVNNGTTVMSRSSVTPANICSRAGWKTIIVDYNVRLHDDEIAMLKSRQLTWGDEAEFIEL